MLIYQRHTALDSVLHSLDPLDKPEDDNLKGTRQHYITSKALMKHA